MTELSEGSPHFLTLFSDWGVYPSPRGLCWTPIPLCRPGQGQCWELLGACAQPGQEGQPALLPAVSHSPKLQLLPHVPKQIKVGNWVGDPVQPAPRSLGGRNAT